MPFLSHSCLSTCLYFLISYTMVQYHVVDYSTGLSLSFKSLYYWQNKFNVIFFPPAYLSVFLWRVSLSIESLGFLWISMHLFSKLVKGFMGVRLVTATGSLGLEVFIAMVVKCSAAWSRDAQILLRLLSCSSRFCTFVWTSVKSLSNLQVPVQYFLIQVLSLSKADGKNILQYHSLFANFATCSFYHYAAGNYEKQCLHQTKSVFLLFCSFQLCVAYSFIPNHKTPALFIFSELICIFLWHKELKTCIGQATAWDQATPF